MILKKRIFLLAIAFLGTLQCYAQPANDDCFNATPLGVLGAPPACAGTDSVVGALSTFNNLTNVNSTAEQPYSALINCQPDGVTPMSLTATDVWYSFVNSGNAVTITINGNIVNPNVGLYDGTLLGCAGLVGRGCAIGSGGTLNATFDQMVIGNTYYLQISGGDALDVGTFNMTLQNSNSCLECLLTSNLTVNPAPTNGGYSGGTTVTFCYTITEWEQQNTNWLHAVIPTFGSGWDMSTLTGLTPAATCDGSTGEWTWFNNVVTPNNNGVLTGFFFDGDLIQEPVPDGDPTNNYGDNCDGSGLNWTFCWTITAKDCPPGQNGDDLGLLIDTYGDGETGNWTNIACSDDPIYQFNASLICCAQPLMSHVDVLCFGGTTGTATADAQGTGPFDYVWKNSSNTTIQTALNQNLPNTVSNLAAGTYTVTVTDQSNGCITTGTVTVSEPTQLQLLIASTAASCNQTNGSATVTPQGGTGPYDFSWTDANNVNIQTANNQVGANTANNLAAGTYNVSVTDANGCNAVVAVVVQGVQGNVAGNVVGVDASCITACDGSATVTLNGGTPNFNYVWTDAANNVISTQQNQPGITSTVNGLCVGVYTVTISDANNCTGTLNVNIAAPPSVVAQFTASPQPTDIFDTRIYFVDRSNGGVTSWSWDFDGLGSSTDQSPSFLFPPNTAGCYDVVLTVDNGSNCPDSDTLVVCIDPNFVIYFPSAFTPNGDYINNTFIGTGEGILKYEMWIFDRWGNKLYYCNDLNSPWDGRKEGSDEVCQDDVYIWKAYVTDVFGMEHEYIGRVTLIK